MREKWFLPRSSSTLYSMVHIIVTLKMVALFLLYTLVDHVHMEYSDC